MRDYPTEHRQKFEEEWDNAINRFEKEFLVNFDNPDGSINWEKLLRFNSGKKKIPWMKIATVISVEDHNENDDTEDLDE